MKHTRQLLPSATIRLFPRGPRLSIAKRTAIWSWLVTLVTVAVFAAVIIPQQKRVFRENLESKALGLAVSLRDVAASAAVNEDYSTVVDYSMQMLSGDITLDFIVITKNDGYSLFAERSGWRADPEAAPEWRPQVREPFSGIVAAPTFGRRVFHYAQPFDYSGIAWGWIHVGLSLDGYDRSVRSVYHRTIVLAVVCISFSLAASMFYARRLVRPVLDLRNVVQRVASGDLAARAAVSGQDELASLAASVNAMTKALLRRDRIADSLQFAAQQFLASADWHKAVELVMANLGDAAGATEARLFENRQDASCLPAAHCRCRWIALPGDAPPVPAPAEPEAAFPERWRIVLSLGEVLESRDDEAPEADRQWLREHGLRSLLATPVRVEGRWWGFLALLDHGRLRSWTEAECSSLQAASDMLGATIARQRTRDALLEAKQTLEDRVLERTRELQEQVEAKEAARTDLAEAQARLIAASRAAGKAEVATSVLHNVGNVLNSVGVSATIIGDRLRRSAFGKLQRAAELLEEQNGALAAFLTSDPRGRHFPAYLSAVSAKLAAENAEMLKELAELGESVEHIKKIVAMQQNYARVFGAIENVHAAELVEDALRMNDSSFRNNRIVVGRNYQAGLPQLSIDRHKVLQILVNLLSNAKHAVLAHALEPRVVTVSVGRAGDSALAIRVRDNGVGISAENLTRIFQFGFTTKREGHGFGLHGGANAAAEMGGRLSVQSDGPGCGAEFTLELKTS